ncbi:serine acetyltransferase [Mucilaginibacter segetis]|uniref:Serine acetyltransferase n=1 Tax=Mucilaginibacter segetis TaxID=2793071 RepID=A0A934ULM2_9SPHI|nr:DapH/DapD/GlmU-related protein [Mucilaginibacter segetis]MBK0378021.1 serine acetyltransferase [Mucilaginibacter segetis]
MNFFAYIFQDWSANRGNIKAQIVLFMFRLVNAINKYMLLKIVFFPYLMFYRFFVEWVLGIELPRKLVAGKGLVFYHGQGLVVNYKVTLGDNCVLRNGVTIGHKEFTDGSLSNPPRIGNNVNIGANASIIGDITIGNNVLIGAGAVVVKNIPDNSIVVGNPARILPGKENFKNPEDI